MDERGIIKDLWRRMEKWLSKNIPEALENLNGPADDEEIIKVEKDIGIALPLAFRESLKIHNGEKNDCRFVIMPGGGKMLSTAEILDTWRIQGCSH